MSNELYTDLYAILQYRERLWFEKGLEGTRKKDISDIVCPLVDRDSLLEMHQSNPSKVKYDFYENVSIMGRPGQAQRWVIRGEFDRGGRPYIFIWIFESGECDANFGRYF